MKHRILPSLATGILLAAGWAASACACDQATKTTAAAASKSQACTAEMAAKCTAAQAAACKARGAAAMASATCNHGANAVTAVNASAKAASGVCPHGASAAAAGQVDAVPVGGYSCGGRGMAATADRFSHGGCDACSDMATCDGELKASGALTQVVKLKNGVMYVYTAQEPGKVHAVQAAVAHRSDRLTAINAAGDRAKLCPECRSMRGAMASGKLTREIVSIEGGCLTLVTSTDASIVAKLHTMVGSQVSSRAKI